MLAKVLAPATVGVNGVLVEVECDITNGLPSFIVVGLGNQAVNEARDRVRGAIRNSKLLLPPKRITLNLAPADLPKDGTAYDVSMAIAILLASEQLEHAGSSLFVGELALDGSLRPVRGVLAYAQLAVEQGLHQLFVPRANAEEASLISGIHVYGADNLLNIYAHLLGIQPLEQSTASLPSVVSNTPLSAPDFASIHGQNEAKRVVEIAAAGGHNLLLSGPPGSGKTMLSKAIVGILPPPTMAEIIEITKLHSLAGASNHQIAQTRPFRSPHHTASDIALIGGGRTPKPGEISLSHRGVLFMDEFPEFRRDVLEVLRQPLEDGFVSIARAAGTMSFPAEFMLVATQNPCPCGYAGDPIKQCSCSLNMIARYNRKISGPLLDRIDMAITVNRIDADALQNHTREESSQVIQARVTKARERQIRRNASDYATNAHINSEELRRQVRLTPEAELFLHMAVHNLGLSARGYIRTLRVALTIADLAESDYITKDYISEAVGYRPRT